MRKSGLCAKKRECINFDTPSNLASKGMNIRETASINQLVVLSNMESANSEMIKQGVSKKQRFEILHKMAKEQLKVLDTNNIEQRFRKILPDSTKKTE